MLIRDALNLIKNQKRLIITILAISSDIEFKYKSNISNMDEIISLYGDETIKSISISTRFDPDIDMLEKPMPVLNIVIEDKEKNIVDELYDNFVKATNLPPEFLGDEKSIKAFISAYLNYMIKTPVPKPEIKPSIENRVLDDNKKTMKLKDLKDFQINSAISALYIDNVGKVFDIDVYGSDLNDALKKYEDYEISDIEVGTDEEGHIWLSVFLKDLEENKKAR